MVRSGGGKQWYPWIHIADEIRAIRFLIESPEASGPFNLTAPNPLTNRAFSRSLGKAMDRPTACGCRPSPCGWRSAKWRPSCSMGSAPCRTRLAGLGFRFDFPDAEAALRDLVASGARRLPAGRG